MRFSTFIYSYLFALLWAIPMHHSIAQVFYGASVTGRVTDEREQPLAGVSIYNSTTGQTIFTNATGDYTMQMRAGLNTELQFSLTGYYTEKRTLRPREDEEREVNVSMTSQGRTLAAVEVKAMRRAASVTNITPKLIEVLPAVGGGGAEAAIKTLPGVVSNNELSSQYSVRGGNFDENLIYVNDFEIYRPFLIRSGQQEGLSFINPDMVSGISFSAGGFEAKYGDRLSSVLDIKYRRPSEFSGNIAASLLGVSGFVQGTAFNKRNTFMLGIRQRSNRYLLNSLPQKGKYTPSFTDIQGLITHQFSDQLQLQVLGNYARNRFSFFPTESAIGFGTFDASYRLTTAYEGEESDSYENGMLGLALVHTPNPRLTLKYMASAYASREIEAFNILGFYYIGEVEKDFTSDDFGDVTTILGVGASHDWARNRLNAYITNVEHRGYWQATPKHFVSWGVKGQHDLILDQLNEWTRTDSADFTLPITQPQLGFKEVLRTNLRTPSNRITAFAQDEWSVSKHVSATVGVRANHWTLNGETVVSPRMQIGWQPQLRQDSVRNSRYQRTLALRGAVGAYYQPPIYREMRRPNGTINSNILAQKSIHAVIGSDYGFTMMGGRPFKLTTELYYKYLWDMISYGYDNLLIRYAGQNDSKGYAAGVDMRLFGEFVRGTESWISLSVMKTSEDLTGDTYNRYRNAAGQFIVLGDTAVKDRTVVDTVIQNIGYIPRPGDQRVTFSMFFQDQLPNNPNFKVHLTLLVGTGLPFGPPNVPRYRNALRIPTYRRLDIGFSALLLDTQKRQLPSRNPLRHLDSIWASLEIFNLLGVNNTVSYNWIKAIAPNYQEEAYYAVPNYLTARLLNARILIKF